MTVIHHHTNGTEPSAGHALIAEHARTIDPERRARYEGYLAEILGALGMDLDTPGTADTPRRLLQALIDATAGYAGDPKLVAIWRSHGAPLRTLVEAITATRSGCRPNRWAASYRPSSRWCRADHCGLGSSQRTALT